MTNTKLSPNEKAEINRTEYAAYVANLEATNTQFPINQFGDVNITAIAESCGFKRGVLQNKNSLLGKRLRVDVKRLGTQIQEAIDNDSSLEKKAKKASVNASKLERELEKATAEIETLRLKLEEAEVKCFKLMEKQHEQTESFEYMLETGRRVFL
jgi:septal ring factor EnvC (AmiA/AmiB activator)